MPKPTVLNAALVYPACSGGMVVCAYCDDRRLIPYSAALASQGWVLREELIRRMEKAEQTVQDMELRRWPGTNL